MEKQIEEMAKDTCCIKNICPNFCNPSEYCTSVKFSKKAYNAGYRKASDVAREIFEEIEKYLVTGSTFYGQPIHSIGVGTFAVLKKKYTEGENHE